MLSYYIPVDILWFTYTTQCALTSFFSVYVPGDQQYSDSEMLEDVCFCCIVRICSTQNIQQMCVLDESKREFTSRHSLEWKFLYIDHRSVKTIMHLYIERKRDRKLYRLTIKGGM